MVTYNSEGNRGYFITASAIQNEDADDNEDPKPEIIPVTGISLNYTNLTLTVGETPI